jgi:diguanylate cyclase (GGDEF)-like protein
MLCTDISDDDDAHAIASRAVRAIGEERVEGEDNLRVTGSIGVVVTAGPWFKPADLLQRADFAMYEAKRAGRNVFRLFDGNACAGGEAPGPHPC